MTYTSVNFYAQNGLEAITPSSRQMGNIDRALVDYEARIAALVAALAALDARVVALEEA